MPPLPQTIKEKFYQTIKGDISLDDFEQWLYADKDLEKHLQSDDYLELISFDFKKNGAKHELWNLLKKHIHLGEFETCKMLELLYEAKQKTEQLPYILIQFYDLYCKGYYFLEDLGLGIGLHIAAPNVNNACETWDELTAEQQKELLDSFSPEMEEWIEQVITWLETKKIILTGEQEQDTMGRYIYKYLRTE
jgi:hypothetical protein